MRLLTYVVTVATLTAGAHALVLLGRHLDLPDVKYVTTVLVFLLPGALYLRLHPAWKSRDATAHEVALATAAGVLAGVLLFHAAQLLIFAAQFHVSPSARQQRALAFVALSAPISAYLVASNVWRNRGARSVAVPPVHPNAGE